MSSVLTLILAGMAGVALGSIFFGGLWFTVRWGLASPRPALWFFFSLILRSALVAGGFYLVGLDHADRIVACLLGLILARILVARLIRLAAVSPESAGSEVGRAS